MKPLEQFLNQIFLTKETLESDQISETVNSDLNTPSHFLAQE